MKIHSQTKSQWTINPFVAASVTHKNVGILPSKLMDPDHLSQLRMLNAIIQTTWINNCTLSIFLFSHYSLKTVGGTNLNYPPFLARELKSTSACGWAMATLSIPILYVFIFIWILALSFRSRICLFVWIIIFCYVYHNGNILILFIKIKYDG